MMMALEGYIDPMPIKNPQTASVIGGLYRLQWGLQGFFEQPHKAGLLNFSFGYLLP